MLKRVGDTEACLKMAIWQTREWKEKAKAFVEDKECVWCGSTENLVPHHPRRRKYTHEEYLSLKYCFVLCKTCNFMEGKGFKLCPKCKKHYFKPKRWYRKKMCY